MEALTTPSPGGSQLQIQAKGTAVGEGTEQESRPQVEAHRHFQARVPQGSSQGINGLKFSPPSSGLLQEVRGQGSLADAVCGGQLPGEGSRGNLEGPMENIQPIQPLNLVNTNLGPGLLTSYMS